MWPGVRGAIGALDPGLVLFWNDTLDASVDDTLLLQRTPMQLLSAFAGLALFLGAVGIYGVVAYAVASRGREIGLGLALGSRRAGILRLVAREWSAIVGLGIVAGLLGAMLAGRALAGLLYGTGALDAAVISATAGIIAATAAAAWALPVRRALQIDPAVALKGD